MNRNYMGHPKILRVIEIMAYKEIFNEFRLLGGTIENIEIRKGEYGNGLFPIKNNEPVKIHIPENLLIPASNISIRNNHLIINDNSNIPPRIKEFFAQYQKQLSWGNGVFLNLLENEINWCTLPEEIQNKIKQIFQIYEDNKIFTFSSCDKILEQYILTRSISYSTNSNESNICIMPIIELINHSNNGVDYRRSEGILIDGTFNGEIFTNYNKLFDPIKFFLQYRFNTNSNIAYSLPVRLVYGKKYIQILRNFQVSEKLNDLHLPKKTNNNDGIELSYLEIGNQKNPSECRKKFNYLMSDTDMDPNELFDQLQCYNRNSYLELLILLKKYDSKINSLFEIAVIQQLQSMSYYW